MAEDGRSRVVARAVWAGPARCPGPGPAAGGHRLGAAAAERRARGRRGRWQRGPGGRRLAPAPVEAAEPDVGARGCQGSRRRTAPARRPDGPVPAPERMGEGARPRRRPGRRREPVGGGPDRRRPVPRPARGRARRPRTALCRPSGAPAPPCTPAPPGPRPAPCLPPPPTCFLYPPGRTAATAPRCDGAGYDPNPGGRPAGPPARRPHRPRRPVPARARPQELDVPSGAFTTARGWAIQRASDWNAF